MSLNQVGYAGGITAFIIVVLACLCALIFLTRYVSTRRLEFFLYGIVLIAVGCNWLGVLISFLKILLGTSPLGRIGMIRAWAWAPAIAVTVWVYLIFATLRPRFKFIAGAIYVVIDFVYFYLIYTKTDQYSTYQLAGGLPDSGMTGIAALFLMFYILTAILIIGSTYLWIGVKSESPEVKLQGKTVGLAVLIFSFSATFDAVVLLSSALLTICVRAMVGLSILLLYLGFGMPEWFQRRFLR